MDSLGGLGLMVESGAFADACFGFLLLAEFVQDFLD